MIATPNTRPRLAHVSYLAEREKRDQSSPSPALLIGSSECFS